MQKPKGVIFDECEEYKEISSEEHKRLVLRYHKWLKGGEKVKPYFEVKIAKLKNEVDGKLKKLKSEAEEIQRTIDRLKGERAYKKGEWSGDNWVNKENLDKIKLPCFCTHKDKSHGYSGYGMLVSSFIKGNTEYVLVDIGKQRSEMTAVSSDISLKELIKNWDIHIIKGKIILFEDSDNNDYEFDDLAD